MPAIGLIILAAGGSTRLGSPKQLLPYGGKSLLQRAVETALASSCRPIVIVLGASAESCLPELHNLPVTIVQNADWQEGMGSSLRIGLETLLHASAVPRDAALVMLCDQPLLTVATLEALVDAFATSTCRIAASAYNGTVGVPALFHSSLFPELLSLTGAQGARHLFSRYPDQTQSIPFPEGALDIDTAADYERLSR